MDSYGEMKRLLASLGGCCASSCGNAGLHVEMASNGHFYVVMPESGTLESRPYDIAKAIGMLFDYEPEKKRWKEIAPGTIIDGLPGRSNVPLLFAESLLSGCVIDESLLRNTGVKGGHAGMARREGRIRLAIKKIEEGRPHFGPAHTRISSEGRRFPT